MRTCSITLVIFALFVPASAWADNEPRTHDPGFFLRLNLGIAWGGATVDRVQSNVPDDTGAPIPIAVRPRGVGLFYHWDIGAVVVDDVAVHLSVGTTMIPDGDADAVPRAGEFIGLSQGVREAVQGRSATVVHLHYGLGATTWLLDEDMSLTGALEFGQGNLIGGFYEDLGDTVGFSLGANYEGWVGNRWALALGGRGSVHFGRGGVRGEQPLFYSLSLPGAVSYQ